MRRYFCNLGAALLCACGGDGSASSAHDAAASEGSAAVSDSEVEGAPRPDADAKEDSSLPDQNSAPGDAAQGAHALPASATAQDAGADATSSSPQPVLATLLEQYRAWPTRYSAPQSISSEIFGLCRLPSLAEQRFADSKHGDGLMLQDYLSPSAKQGFDTKVTPFAMGAAIVKEKLAAEAGASFMVVARGLMLKRGPGFDPAHGDWEFGYWEASTGLSTGSETQSYCGGCHASASTDFVFLDQSWRRP
jgi:hypothetical protein